MVRFLLIIQQDIYLQTEVPMYAQLIFSSRKRRRLGSATAVAGICAMVLAGEVAADSYNFWLKKGASDPYIGTNNRKCAVGNFSFVKSGVPGGPVTSPTMSISQGCIQTGSPAFNLTLSGTLSADVRNINLNGEPQGPNVDGLTGTLSSQSFSQACQIDKVTFGNQILRWDVIFSSSPGANGAPGLRTYNINQVIGVCTTGTPDFNNPTTQVIVSQVPYHLLNTIHQVPEPETLWLALGGLGALVMARRKRRRA